MEARDIRQLQEPTNKLSYPSTQINRRDMLNLRQEGTHKHQQSQQLREQFEQDGYGTLNPKVIDEILGLREMKISLMKQLNQQTSNYNRVIMENRHILNENHHLKEQMNEKQNMENIPLVHKLSKENQKLKEKLARLELELQKATGKSYTEKNHRDGSRSPQDPEQEDHESANYEKLKAQLKQYREMYGELPRPTQPSSPKQQHQHRRIGNGHW